MKITISLLVILISIMLISCGNNKHRDFTMGKDGLFYKYSSKTLYSGTIIDTVDVIVQYSVIWGKKNGQFITRYLNGRIEKFGFIINNQNEGEWKYYYPNGTIECKGRYEINKANGKWIYYYPSGTIMTEGNFINGAKDGIWIIYDINGNVANLIFYRNGNFLDIQNKIS